MTQIENTRPGRTSDRALSTAQGAGVFSPRQLDNLENWLDSRFTIPGTSIRIGLDGVIGLIPGIGDTLTAGLSAMIIYDAHRKGARKRTLTRMVSNSAIDLVIGTIPLVGDLFDFAYKSNAKNVRLLKQELQHLEQRSAEDRDHTTPDSDRTINR